MMYGSFFGQLLERRGLDPCGLPNEGVVAVKGLLCALCVVGLVITLTARRSSASERRTGA
jgi:hypothetical protein